MAKKISDLTAISGGVFSDNDLFEVSVDTGGGSYVSRKILGSEVKTTIGGANIGNSDLTINTSGARKLILGGALSTDSFTIRNSADSADYFKVDGTGNVQINNEIGQGTTPLGTINYFMSKTNNTGFYVAGNYSSAAFQIDAGTGIRNFYCRNIPNNASGYEAQAVNAGTGTRKGFYSQITGTGATNNIGIDLNVANATNNYAIQITAGDIKTPSGLGQTGTYTFGGGSSGDIATMQFEKGVLIAVTTVP